jgi:hypothetical protein
MSQITKTLNNLPECMDGLLSHPLKPTLVTAKSYADLVGQAEHRLLREQEPPSALTRALADERQHARPRNKEPA